MAAGRIVAVLGPSGGGKTSLLRAIAGLEPVAGGRIEWDGEDLTRTPPHRRGFGLMFQDHALFGHIDVAANVRFGLRMQGRPAREQADRAAAMLELVGLETLADRPVDGLSGGEQQRVALARALAPEPRLLMLDEPLASVDRERREQLAAELHRVIRTTGTATLLVTHDLDEAFTLADRIAVMDLGRLLQVDAPPRLWQTPADRRVAEFLGYEAFVARGAGVAEVLRGGVVDVCAEHRLLAVGPGSLEIADAGALTGTVRFAGFRRGVIELTGTSTASVRSPSSSAAPDAPAPGTGLDLVPPSGSPDPGRGRRRRLTGRGGGVGVLRRASSATCRRRLWAGSRVPR